MNSKIKNALCISGKYALCFVCLIALFVLLMTLAYMIPDSRIEWHREYSLYVLTEIEETWESFGNLFGLHSQPGMPDNTTDRIMMQETKVQDETMSALQAAMYMNGYTRYWHGYQVVLRPLLVFYQLHQIRYLNMFAFFGVFCLVLFALRQRTGKLSAAAFFMAMVCAHIVAIPMSMQYMAVFIQTMLMMLLILWRYPFAKRENLPLFFMAAGMIINFLDFLTVPVVTLGVPLLLFLYMDHREQPDIRRAAKTAFSCSVAWAAGYGLCWISKWILSFAVLGKSIFSEVTGKIQQWAVHADHAQGRMETVVKNFQDYFMLHGLRSMVFPLLFAVLLLAALVLFGRRERQAWLCGGVMLAVSLYPYMWYFVLMEHSWLHHWFTYRAQVVSQFGGYMTLILLIDWQRLRARLCASKERLTKKRSEADNR